MANPVLIEVTRSGRIESAHRGAVAIVNGSGGLVHAAGDVEAPIYPRSALKPIQAVPLIESGAADTFGLGEEEIALACASHSGEDMHTSRVAAWLARIGCTVADLACGPHELRHEPTRDKMRARGEKLTPLHNNCSGKHTGFLTVARQLRVPVADYTGIHHPVQDAVAGVLKDLTGLSGEIPWGVDGCTAPNFFIPLSALARAMAGLASPQSPHGAAADKILAAMMRHPELVAGSGRLCTRLMREAPGKLVVKTGAEGVYAAIFPERGLGIALKIDDGTTRASEAAIEAILSALGAIGSRDASSVLDTRGRVAGERRATADLTMGLNAL
jgi:L-asparaginase II